MIGISAGTLQLENGHIIHRPKISTRWAGKNKLVPLKSNLLDQLFPFLNYESRAKSKIL